MNHDAPWHLGRDLEPLGPWIRDPLKKKKTASNGCFLTSFRRAITASHWNGCAYCGDGVSGLMIVDHVLPKALGGTDEIENLIGACLYCNSAKSARPLEQFRTVLALRFSPIAGIISSSQASRLIDAGVSLPIHNFRFYFEEYLEAAGG